MTDCVKVSAEVGKQEATTDVQEDQVGLLAEVVLVALAKSVLAVEAVAEGVEPAVVERVSTVG